ncbi:chemotaxis protein CheB [Tropicimonas sp. IMCC34011]|uniref:chemotaxis protein CheB n=1 Tax=Tropicimonas sp. IMCC34011 TaxID=2248759 RepID=UPI000E259D5A|nr:chemotaxis protein CheB [Tropicimonas sp. IMCC34011]
MKDVSPDPAEEVDSNVPLIVGIGASAGGLEAFQEVLRGLPERHDLALVLVQHLDPDHESLLPELLSRQTNTPVHSVTDGVVVEPGQVYLIPPNARMMLRDGRLHLQTFESPRGLRRPIDEFFQSLASEARDRSVGIVLSGTGSDGSTGVKAIKESGGLVFVQDPKQAKYDGMPRAAMSTGAVDLVLPTSEMIDVVNDYYDRRTGVEPSLRNDAQFVSRVVRHVRYRTGHDFTDYKQGTLLRRLAVRMSVLGITRPEDYLRTLIDHKSEASRLVKDLLINVTSFFRDPDAFRQIEEEIIPAILDGKGPSDEVRIWVPGCSTGQEAYSLAILFAEAAELRDIAPHISVFATDIDEDALAEARAGIYSSAIAEEMSRERLENFFRPHRSGFEVRSGLRDMVRFSVQSLVRDPPFSRVDLLSCRNVTIYFNENLQSQASRVFQYAVRPEGFLFIGPSEMLPDLPEAFSERRGSGRVFQRQNTPALPLSLPRTASRPPEAVREPERAEGAQPGARERRLLERHVPPHVLIDASDNVTYSSDGAERFLMMRAGATRTGILSLIRPELEGTVRRLLNSAVKSDDAPPCKEFEGEVAGEAVRLLLTLETLDRGLRMLVLRDSLDVIGRPEPESAAEDTTDAAYVRGLEIQLDEARETIRTTVEELETSNEELKSSNEEMMSMNEELQSANEELSTVNEELKNKLSELNQANTDLSNFIRSTRIPTVFLDEALRLRSFTEESREFFRFVETDKGRTIDDIGSDLDIDRVADICRSVIESGEPDEQEMRTRDGARDVVFRALPYHGEAPDQQSGVVFTMSDVTDLHAHLAEIDRQRETAQASLTEIEGVYRSSPQAMGLLGPDFRLLRANEQLAALAGRSTDACIGERLSDLIPNLWQDMSGPADEVFDTNRSVVDVKIPDAPSDDDARSWLLDCYPVAAAGSVRAVGVTLRDISELTRLQTELQRVMRELQHRVKNMLANVLALVNRARGEAVEDKEVFRTLAMRIEALSNTHKLLTTENWGAAELHSVLEPELTSVYGADRATLKGPRMRLNARATLAVGMAIHELATNAAKYGAFSQPGGKVKLSWVRIDEGDGDIIRMTWRETGGPTVEPAEKQGFGSQLIASTIEGALDGNVTFDWNPGGLVCVLEFDCYHAKDTGS